MVVRPGSAAGFSAGLKYWLFFMIALALLGYSPFLSICLGAIGGIAGGVVAAWFNPKDDDAPDRPARTVEVSPDEPRRRRPFGAMPRKGKRQDTRASRNFGWPFRRNAPR